MLLVRPFQQLEPKKMPKSGYIAIIGRPNAGKSTLLNAVLQTEISIVTPKAQTTRDRILGILTEKPGQIVFIDTPGIHKALQGGINEYMVNQAKEALDAPNLIWYLVDPYSGIEHENTVLDLLEKAPRSPLFLIMNKIDALSKRVTQTEVDALESKITQSMKDRGISYKKTFLLSALKNQGVNPLLEESWNFIPEGVPFYPDPEQVSDRPTRFFVAEKIRERLYYLLGEELPYSCAVEIEAFKENTKPVRIEANIYVERESQKGMVIGSQGKKIKEIGQAARAEIEKFLGEQIFLGLKVKVLPHWTDNAEGLRKIGYSVPQKKKRR